MQVFKVCTIYFVSIWCSLLQWLSLVNKHTRTDEISFSFYWWPHFWKLVTSQRAVTTLRASDGTFNQVFILSLTSETTLWPLCFYLLKIMSKSKLKAFCVMVQTGGQCISFWRLLGRLFVSPETIFIRKSVWTNHVPPPPSADSCVVCCRMRWRSFAARCWRCETCSRRRRCTSCRSCGCSWSRPTKAAASCSTASARPSAGAFGWLRRGRWTGSWSGVWSTTLRCAACVSCPVTGSIAQRQWAIQLSSS